MSPEGGRSQGGQPVGTAPVVTLHRLDEPLSFEPAERLVERARREPDIREGLDVLGQGVPVFRPIRQARQDQGRRPGVAAEAGERLGGAFLIPCAASSSP